MIIKAFTIDLKKIFIVAVILFSTSVSAQNTDRQIMDSLRNAFIQYRNATTKDFEEYKKKRLEDYTKYLEQVHTDYQAWRNSMKQTWGAEGDSVETTKTVWVEYSSDNSNRSIVDFDKGNIIVEAIVPEGGNSSSVNANLTTAIARILNSRGSTCPYPSSVDKSEPLTDKPILDNLLNLSTYKVDDEVIKEKKTGPNKKYPLKTEVKKQYSNTKIAKAIAEQSPQTIKNIVGNDGKSRKVVQVKMAMVSDNLSKNAALYKDIVAEFSKKFNIEQPLIFAVMEQESRFNPEAVSTANACGLMQLVATSGGADAYKYVYGKEWTPTRSYLFNPRNNIELGTAYLRVLTNQFIMVNDEDCRRLCVIAGYNTGAGNVSRAFTGIKNVFSAIPHINKHSYKSLYNHLTNKLSTKEARNYVAGVSKRREKYLK